MSWHGFFWDCIVLSSWDWTLCLLSWCNGPHRCFLGNSLAIVQPYPLPSEAIHHSSSSSLPTLAPGLDNADFVFVHDDTHCGPLGPLCCGHFHIESHHDKYLVADSNDCFGSVSVDRLKPACLTDHDSYMTRSGCVSQPPVSFKGRRVVVGIRLLPCLCAAFFLVNSCASSPQFNQGAPVHSPFVGCHDLFPWHWSSQCIGPYICIQTRSLSTFFAHWRTLYVSSYSLFSGQLKWCSPCRYHPYWI